jgi:hypothetical protein
VSRIRPQVTGPDLAGPAALLDELINVLAWGLGEGSGMKPYDAMNDDERTEVAGEAVRHLSHEIETLAELRSRIRLALAILTAAKPDAARFARLALEGAPINELMLQSAPVGEGK